MSARNHAVGGKDWLFAVHVRGSFFPSRGSMVWTIHYYTRKSATLPWFASPVSGPFKSLLPPPPPPTQSLKSASHAPPRPLVFSLPFLLGGRPGNPRHSLLITPHP